MKITHKHPNSGVAYEIEIDRNIYSISKEGVVVHSSTAVQALGSHDVGESTVLAIAKSWVDQQDG